MQWPNDRINNVLALVLTRRSTEFIAFRLSRTCILPMGRLVNYYYVIDRARCNARSHRGFPAAVYLPHTHIYRHGAENAGRAGDATTVLQAVLEPVRANACVTEPRLLGVSNFDVAEPSCKGMVMVWEQRERGELARRRRERQVPELQPLLPVPRNMLRHNVGETTAIAISS